MKERKSIWGSPLGRGLAVLAVLLLAVAVVSPAFSAHSNAHVKKIAKKVAMKLLKTQIPAQGGPVFIEETELVRFGPVKMSAGATDVTLGTFGPFTIKGNCTDSAGNKIARAIITTTEANSAFGSYQSGDEDDFDPTDTAIYWNEATSSGTSTDTYGIGTGHAEAPSGTTLDGSVNAVAELGGVDCTFFGYFLPTTA